MTHILLSKNTFIIGLLNGIIITHAKDHVLYVYTYYLYKSSIVCISTYRTLAPKLFETMRTVSLIFKPRCRYKRLNFTLIVTHRFNTIKERNCFIWKANLNRYILEGYYFCCLRYFFLIHKCVRITVLFYKVSDLLSPFTKCTRVECESYKHYAFLNKRMLTICEYYYLLLIKNHFRKNLQNHKKCCYCV